MPKIATRVGRTIGATVGKFAAVWRFAKARKSIGRGRGKRREDRAWNIVFEVKRVKKKSMVSTKKNLTVRTGI